MLRGVLLLILLLVSSCSTNPPRQVEDACAIFREQPDWYQDTYEVEQRYGLPIAIQLAIMRQESSFRADAAPPHRTLLGFIPWSRPSTAYGYAQAKDETWDWYRSQTKRYGDQRDNFADAVQFMGWYASISYRTLGISKWDAYNQYLAYHEGHGGFKKKSYEQKPWLKQVATKVKNNAARYSAQLKKCSGEFKVNSSWWPF